MIAKRRKNKGSKVLDLNQETWYSYENVDVEANIGTYI